MEAAHGLEGERPSRWHAHRGPIRSSLPRWRSAGLTCRKRPSLVLDRDGRPRLRRVSFAAHFDSLMFGRRDHPMLSRRLAAVLAAAAMTTGLAVAGSLPARAALMQHIELHAALQGSHAHPRTIGTAFYESGDHGRVLDVHVSRIAGLAGSRLTVYVHGVRAGTMTVSRTGFAHLDRHRGASGRPRLAEGPAGRSCHSAIAVP